MTRNGQAVLEFALVLPIQLLLLLGVLELGFYEIAILRAENGIAVLTQLAAEKPGWESVIAEEDDRSGCHADPRNPDVVYPDGDSKAGSRIRLTWHCTHEALSRLVPSIARYDVQSEAVIAGKESPDASPSPSPSPSS